MRVAVVVLHADAVVRGDDEPIGDGAIAVAEDGVILDVGRAPDVLPRHAGARIERVRGVVLPGLVNAHTHLELSALRGAVPGGAGFVPWVERLIGIRIEMRPDEDAQAIDAAVADLDGFGTAAVGEVTNSLASVGALRRERFAGCVFHEVSGIERGAVMRRVGALAEDVHARFGHAAQEAAPDLAYALAPHALYTTHADAVRTMVDHARVHGRRTSIHLAEHAAERRVLERGDGPIADWVATRLKIPRAAQSWPGASPVALAAELGVLAPHVVLVHLADAREDELAKVADAGAPVVLCPRSNLHIEAKLPPVLAMLRAGIAPALGTDSLASNGSLDVLAEARAIADRFPSVAPSELVRMATWNGASALGLPDLGRVAVGARPGLFAIDGDLGELEPCAFALRHVKAKRRWIIPRAQRPTKS
jgi:cytosine/adenosine deaminase-related metal-dependent hydrolase